MSIAPQHMIIDHFGMLVRDFGSIVRFERTLLRSS
jgi:hypothetical protein